MEGFMPVGYDWTLLNAKLNPKKDRIDFQSTKHLFRKVAFDVYKPISGSDRLWELRHDEDGKEYLIALYSDEDDLVVESQEDGSNKWTAVADHEGKNVTLSYRDFPITRIAIAQYGVDSHRAEDFARFVEKKATDKNFIANLLASMPESKRQSVMKLLGKEDS